MISLVRYLSAIVVFPFAVLMSACPSHADDSEQNFLAGHEPPHCRVCNQVIEFAEAETESPGPTVNSRYPKTAEGENACVLQGVLAIAAEKRMGTYLSQKDEMELLLGIAYACDAISEEISKLRETSIFFSKLFAINSEVLIKRAPRYYEKTRRYYPDIYDFIE